MSHETAAHEPMSRGLYYKIYFILMGLLVATVGAVFIHLGPLNFPVAMIIASVKAVLVIMYFMHVKFSEKTTWLFSAAGFVFLAFLLVGVMIDYLSRTFD